MAVSSPSEETTSALTGAHLLLRRIELRGRKLLGSGFIGYDALLHLLIISSNSENLPRSHDAVVKSIHHVKDIPAAEAHFALLRLLVVEVSSVYFAKILVNININIRKDQSISFYLILHAFV